MNQLDVSVCCKSCLTDIRGKSISCSLTPSTWAGVLAVNFSPLWPLLGFLRFLSLDFLHQTCDSVPKWDLSGYSLTPPPSIPGEILAKSIARSRTLSPTKTAKAIPLGISRSTSCREICSDTQKQSCFTISPVKVCFNSGQQWQRRSRKCSLSEW